MKYRPTAFDIQWTRNLIDQMNDGGIWGIPRANSVWRFDKTNKVLIQIHGNPNEPDNKALRIICPLIGWTTAYKAESLTPEQVKKAMEPINFVDHGAGKTTERPI